MATTHQVLAQSSFADSLQTWLAAHPQVDTVRINRLNALSKAVRGNNPALQLGTAQEALRLAKRLGYRNGQALAYLNLSLYAMTRNDYAQATRLAQQSQQLYTQLNDRLGQVDCLNRLAFIDFDQGKYPQSIAQIHQAQRLAESLTDLSLKAYINLLLAQNYTKLDDLVNAGSLAKSGLRLAQQANDILEQNRALSILATISSKQNKLTDARRYYEQTLPLADQAGSSMDRATTEGNIAEVCARQGKYADALRYGRQARTYFKRNKIMSYLPWIDAVLTKAFLYTGKLDSALVYGQRSLREADAGGLRDISAEVDQMLAILENERGNYRTAYQYQIRYMALKDSLKGEETVRQTAALQRKFDLANQQTKIALLTKNQKIEQEHSRTQQVLLVATLGGILLLLILAVVLIRNNWAKQRTNVLLLEQKQALETTLTNLQTTQTQLIHQAKMASLGELTAGIAHEIQNPLNFVNNFSEVSLELMDELADEIKLNNFKETELITQDISENLFRINHHGKRAGMIVSGMLAHARTSTSERHLSDINRLCEEYLNLGYHSFKVKDEGVNVQIVTDFDQTVGEVNVIPQELGRALINLFTNAFYAVLAKQKQLQTAATYQPTVRLSTHRRNGLVTIRIHDNGTGIAPDALPKIYQPFFTTKPTGEGVGLGLSLSYDIITNGHGGTLSATTQENEFTEFALVLPTATEPLVRAN